MLCKVNIGFSFFWDVECLLCEGVCNLIDLVGYYLFIYIL